MPLVSVLASTVLTRLDELLLERLHTCSPYFLSCLIFLFLWLKAQLVAIHKVPFDFVLMMSS